MSRNSTKLATRRTFLTWSAQMGGIGAASTLLPAAVRGDTANAFVRGLSVQFFTLDDDKDDNDTILLDVLGPGPICQQLRLGANQTWKDHTVQGPFHLYFPRGYNTRGLVLQLTKVGSKKGWNMSVQAHGIQYDGRHVLVLPRTRPVRFSGKNYQPGGWRLN